MFPMLEKIKDQEESEPFFVDYVITAKGWRASGGLKCKHPEDENFWSMLEMVIKGIIEGNNVVILNESYTSGFARYVRPVTKDDFTQRWIEWNDKTESCFYPVTGKSKHTLCLNWGESETCNKCFEEWCKYSNHDETKDIMVRDKERGKKKC